MFGQLLSSAWPAMVRGRRGLMAVLLIGLLLRVAMVTYRFDQLRVDTDAYLAIAERLVAGHGFCSVRGFPTAYRPPLFPLLVAVSTSCCSTLGLAVMQVGLGLGTIFGTWWLARRVLGNEGTQMVLSVTDPVLCCPSSPTPLPVGARGERAYEQAREDVAGDRRALIAALLVAVDPLLLLYSSQAMTEVLMAALTIGFSAALWLKPGRQRAIVAGAMFGLLALCRPSIWPFAALAGAWSLWVARREDRWPWSERGLFVLVATVMLLPWCVRNAMVFGRPILTTTHGGYTAILGNNDSFDRSVVSQRFGASWSKDAFDAWQDEVEGSLTERGLERTDEVGRDAAMKEMAWVWIQFHPDRFIRAAIYRVLNLWSPVPMQPGSTKGWLIAIVGAGYVALATLAVVGGWCGLLDRHFRRLTLLMLLSLTALHCVFWANARMRAPTQPLIAILAAAGAERLCSRSLTNRRENLGVALKTED